MSVKMGDEIGMSELVSLPFKKAHRWYLQFLNKRRIKTVERDIELLGREIAERLLARNTLQAELMLLRVERKSI